VAPAVITDQLMTEFAIGGAALGNLSAFYFYSYVAMQIPTGMIADRWGPRRLLTAVGPGWRRWAPRCSPLRRPSSSPTWGDC
jgi:MFS family permease